MLLRDVLQWNPLFTLVTSFISSSFCYQTIHFLAESLFFLQWRFWLALEFISAVSQWARGLAIEKYQTLCPKTDFTVSTTFTLLIQKPSGWHCNQVLPLDSDSHYCDSLHFCILNDTLQHLSKRVQGQHWVNILWGQSRKRRTWENAPNSPCENSVNFYVQVNILNWWANVLLGWCNKLYHEANLEMLGSHSGGTIY